MNMNNSRKYIVAALIAISMITFLNYQQSRAESEASQKFVDEINAEVNRRDEELQPLIERNKRLGDPFVEAKP
jgi:c-di-AMP phosphodiesterase-like protein